MGLVDDERVVGPQQRVALGFGQQDAVGHQLDRSPGLEAVGEAHLVADMLTQRRADFVGDASRHRDGRQTARLGMADQPAATRTQATAQGQCDLRQLRGLARAGLAADDHHLMRGDGGSDVVAPAADRQFGRKLQRRNQVDEARLGEHGGLAKPPFSAMRPSSRIIPG